MSAYLEYAERCEQATGPDRRLDADIAYGKNALDWLSEAHHAPRYTASLDAAMTLADRLGGYGGASGLLREAMDRLWQADFNGRLDHPARTPRAYRESLARFLTAACLRARDSDRSGEAIETTKTGSTSGESAGLQGIAQPPAQSPTQDQS